ncbi:MAG: hypothetical protein WKF58_01495 [Ilumatobacteraceae bacterium]
MSVTDPRSTATPMPGMASGEAGIADVAESRPMRKDVIKRFVGNPLAMIGLTFIVILILVAIFADFIAPMGFAERSDPQISRGTRRGLTGSAPTSSAVTSSRASCTAPACRSRSGSCRRR